MNRITGIMNRIKEWDKEEDHNMDLKEINKMKLNNKN